MEFEGSDFEIMLGFVSIYQKYKDLVYFPMQNNDIMHIKWIDGERLEILDDMWIKIDDSTSRIVVIPLILYNEEDEYAHMNIIVYDKKRMDVQRFDPNGESDNIYNVWLLDHKLKFEFIDYIGSSVNYIESDNTCPIQVLQESQMSSEGYCSVWCFWYLELRLSYINEDPYKLEKIAYIELNKNDNLLNFIQSYGRYILSMKDLIRIRIKEKFDKDFIDIKYSNKYVRDIIKELLPIQDISVLFNTLKIA